MGKKVKVKEKTPAERRGLANGERLPSTRPSQPHENKRTKGAAKILKKEIKTDR